MKKKLLSILLCGTMIGSMLTACGSDGAGSGESTQLQSEAGNSSEAGSSETGSSETESSAEQSEAPAPAEVTPEALPDAFAHYTFDGEDEGYAIVKQANKADDSINDGGTYDIVPSDVTPIYADGAVGKALYMDSTYGLDLNLEPTNTDVYTVSYWVNARFFFDFGPTLQIGYNIGREADAGNNVTWINVTQTGWGADSAKLYPTIWSRNEASDAQDGTDCWPWMSGWDDSTHGKQEWAMITIVCSGEKQDGPNGTTTPLFPLLYHRQIYMRRTAG